MIERQFVNQKLKEFQIQEHIGRIFNRTGFSHIEIRRTPLGENVIVYTTRPGIVVGKKGSNIKKLTLLLKNKYKLENPQLEIGEIENPMMDVHYVADRIAASIERFGQKRFKSIGYRVLQDIMNAGAIGAEVVLSGKIPSARARSWRFSAGYLKKSGDINENLISKKSVSFTTKMGTVGIMVRIMTPDIVLLDKQLEIKEEFKTPQVEEGDFKEIDADEKVKISSVEDIDVIEITKDEKSKDNTQQAANKVSEEASPKKEAPTEAKPEVKVEAKPEVKVETVKEEVKEVKE
ncbi:30S ribosomal protein S3 [Candidatus Woesearchaeota archaeon]|nr:30S ribosomal protein S3 [Candidatus Woesearchaeota archaeon]